MKKLFTYLLLIAVGSNIAYYFFPEKKLPPHSIITKLVVYKSQRKMMAYEDGQLLKTYTIALGKNPIGTKQYEGDNKTPEGHYVIFDKNPNSVCHKNLGVSYPNDTDREIAKQLGKPTGGDIKIHGLKNGQGFVGKFHRFKDWTNGCIGVTDEEIDELFGHTATGIPIIIYP